MIDYLVIQQVEQLVGTPYCYGSWCLHKGLDCLTCCAEVYLRAGLRFPLPERYEADQIPAEVLETWSQQWERIPRREFLAIVEMQFGDEQHVGVCLDRDRIIHCRRGGVVIQRARQLRPWIRAYYRLRQTSGDVGDRCSS